MHTTAKIILFFLALCVWMGLISQFYLFVVNSKVSFLETVVHYFSFFTILTNLIVAICSTILLTANKASLLYSFFSKTTALTAIAVYILIVGIIFNVMLRPIIHMNGIQEISSDLLHVAAPLLFLIYWIKYVPKENMKKQFAFVWLIYPVIYIVYTIIHGWITGFYPYPFINISKLGLSKAMFNGLIILLSFFVLSLLFIEIKRIKHKDAENL
jgi:hypothetical protein